MKAEGGPAGAPPPVPAPAPPQAAAASKPLPQPAARGAAGAAASAPAPVAKEPAVEPVEQKKKSDAPKKAKDGKDKAEKKEGKEAKIRQLVTDLIKAKLLWNAVLYALSRPLRLHRVLRDRSLLSRAGRDLACSRFDAHTTYSRAWTSATLQASYEAEEDEDLKLQCNLHAVTVNEALSEKLLEKHLEDAACAFDKRCVYGSPGGGGRSDVDQSTHINRPQLSAGDGCRSGGLMSRALRLSEERR